MLEIKPAEKLGRFSSNFNILEFQRTKGRIVQIFNLEFYKGFLSMKQFTIPVVLLVLTFAVWVGAGFYLRPHYQTSSFQDGWEKPAPVFQLPKLAEPAQTFDSAALKGQVYLLNFWASWCISCKQEHPFLLELADEKRVRIYSVNYRDTREAARQVLAQTGNPYLATAFDPQGLTTQGYGIVGTPITFVIDKQGIVRYKLMGPLNTQKFEQIIAPLLHELEQA